MPADDDRERAAQAILERAKAVRNPLPRGVWVLGLAIGLAFTIAAIIAITRTPSTTATPAKPSGSASSSGLGLGIAIGLAAGLAIGFAVGRRSRAAGPLAAQQPEQDDVA